LNAVYVKYRDILHCHAVSSRKLEDRAIRHCYSFTGSKLENITAMQFQTANLKI
jgi:hypothetical protein